MSHLSGGYLCSGGVDNEHVAVHSNQEDGEAREEHTGGLSSSDQFTKILHVLSQSPVLKINRDLCF